MASTGMDLDKWDRQIRKELGVSDSAWIRQATPVKIELRIGENLQPLASASDEGAHWCVELPSETMFIGDELAARRALWACAAEAPRQPTPPRRTARPRVGFDSFNRPE